MGIDVYNAYSNLASNPAWLYGESVLSGGMYVRQGISGYGQITRGFLWGQYDIWIDIQRAAPIVTSWTDSDPVITTTWSEVSDQSITTVWSSVGGGTYGEVTS